MGKWTDKLYITHSEWADNTNSFGGVSTQTTVGAQKRKIGWGRCMCGFTELGEDVVATRGGEVYDVRNILPFIKKYGTSPVTGKKLGIRDLITLKLAKNKDQQYICPVTFKPFTQYTKIVAIKPTGNVFSWEAIEQFNLKPKHLNDLIDSTPFVKEDLIVLHDPNDTTVQPIENFHAIRNKLHRETAKEDDIRLSGTAERIFQDIEQRKPAQSAEKKPNGDSASIDKPKAYNTAVFSDGKAAASLTSTSAAVTTKNTAALEDKDLYMYDRIKKMAYLKMNTSLGELNIELFSDSTPKTCHNFLTLAETGYYDNTIFHRNIPRFMIQGGDPTGTGRGGESMWKGKFADEFVKTLRHADRGYLSMANSGKDTNGSQFFITYRDAPHLDKKHTVFGRVVGGLATLDAMEKVETGKNNKPIVDIKILGIEVLVNPFALFDEKVKARTKRAEEQAAAESAFRKRKLPSDAAPASSSVGSIGKYMKK